jgi:hypothetical protein
MHGIVSFALGLGIIAAVARPAEGQDPTDLTRVLDAWHAAAKAGDLDKWLAVRTADIKKELTADITPPGHRKQAVLFARAQAADSYEVRHVAWNKDGKTATLFILAQFSAMPEVERPAGKMEESITFKKEAGAWKMELVRPLGDPDKIKHPADLNYDPENAKQDSDGNIGGRIVSVDFKPKYTVVILRVMDEENAVFLPPKDVLEKAGVTSETLAPWKLHEFDGHPHKTDSLKFFATAGKPIEE